MVHTKTNYCYLENSPKVELMSAISCFVHTCTELHKFAFISAVQKNDSIHLIKYN